MNFGSIRYRLSFKFWQLPQLVNGAGGKLERHASGRGKVIITASAANEVSVEKDELQHGVFT